MRHYSWFSICAGLALFTSCSDDGGGAAGGGSTTTGGTDEPAPLCMGAGPLTVGDAPWVKAPFAPPGDMGSGGDDGGEDGDWTGAGGFIEDPDGGGVSFECDVWAQDCPEGEKCMPWANDGGSKANATRCSPIASMPAVVDEACMVEGGPTSGIDDCDGLSMCWDVDRANEGLCKGFCEGTPKEPTCPGDQWCYIGGEGTVHVCLPGQLCAADGVCQCMCPQDTDPDCGFDQCDEPEAEAPNPDRLESPPPRHIDEEESICPDTQDPVVLYMSNDDSNSQASPILARAYIEEGAVVPGNRIRVHEFLNYFDLSAEAHTDGPAKVGIEMRRTDADSGEFTLVLRAQGPQLLAEDRPPMNLVFSLDTSGSMAGEAMILLRDSMTAVAGELRPGDVVSVVSWSTSQDVPLAGYMVTGPDDPELLSVISGLSTGGGTDLHQGLVSAYNLANTYHIDDGINRVVLISDGGANAGITETDLIASEASDADGEGTYLVGVGVASGLGYSDELMDAITDAGKGAYMYVDSTAEADKQLGERFLANTMVAARNVQMQLTLPWYFGIKSFSGEEYSGDPAEVEPQHLSPNDSMTFHQVISACDAELITTCDSITAHVDYVDPLTGAAGSDELTVSVESIVQEAAPRLYKADVVVGYAKALIVISYLRGLGQNDAALEVATNMATWAEEAAVELADSEVQEIADLMGTYVTVLGG